jgi:hypothetical protein
MDVKERETAARYLRAAGWIKDPCGWWTSPFGYGLDEAVALHKEAAERTARAFEKQCTPEEIRVWLEHERAEMDQALLPPAPTGSP